MIAIENTLVSDDLMLKDFVCNLQACKGECCVAGDSGAPLEKHEAEKLNKILPEVLPFVPVDGRKVIQSQGVAVIDSDGDLVTPLVDGDKHCAFVYFDEQQVAKCSIEKAYLEGHVDFKKPISCHLYPVRVTNFNTYVAVNYHRWDVCHDACVLGKSLKVPVYQFLKEPLIRKFGEDWYHMLEAAATQVKDNY